MASIFQGQLLRSLAKPLNRTVNQTTCRNSSSTKIGGNLIPKIAYYSSRWAGTAYTFGAASILVFLYVSDWRVIVDKIPFYRKGLDDPDKAL